MSKYLFPGAVHFDVQVAIAICTHGAIPNPAPIGPVKLGLEPLVSVGGQLACHVPYHTTECTEHLR